MDSRWLVVPTRNDHPDLLAGLVVDCKLPPERVIVVATESDLTFPMLNTNVCVLYDVGPTNIQRWWNTGIQHAESFGAEFVTVVNDDVVLSPKAIPLMVRALQRYGSDLCWAAPYITGWCWTLRLASPVRPDERFQWFRGDNDLEQQAFRAGGVSHTSAGALHLHPDEFSHTPRIQELIAADWDAYEKKWEGRDRELD